MKKLAFLILAILAFAGHAEAQLNPIPADSITSRRFLDLGTPRDGVIFYCVDCLPTSTCSVGGTGAYAFRLAGSWTCAEGAGSIAPAYGGIVLASSTVTVSQAEVQALATTEKDIVSGVTGFVLIPRLSLIAKAAGAYTVAGVTSLLVGWGSVADNLPACAWGGSPAFSLLVSAGADDTVGCALLSNGVAGGIPFGLFPSTAGRTGKKLAIRTTGASPAGAGGALSVRIYYEKVPDTFFVP